MFTQSRQNYTSSLVKTPRRFPITGACRSTTNDTCVRCTRAVDFQCASIKYKIRALFWHKVYWSRLKEFSFPGILISTLFSQHIQCRNLALISERFDFFFLTLSFYYILSFQLSFVFTEKNCTYMHCIDFIGKKSYFIDMCFRNGFLNHERGLRVPTPKRFKFFTTDSLPWIFSKMNFGCGICHCFILSNSRVNSRLFWVRLQTYIKYVIFCKIRNRYQQYHPTCISLW